MSDESVRTISSADCTCSRQRVIRCLATLNKKDMDDIIADNEPIEVKCPICDASYMFSIEELFIIRDR